MRSVLQDWVMQRSMMQQTVLLTAVRGPDGLPKYGPVKYLLRWYRRCFLVSSLDHRVLTDPFDATGGGSFMGAVPNERRLPWPDADKWEKPLDLLVGDYIRTLDEVPHHFQLHFLHAAEIVGYHHPDERIRAWWCGVYRRLVEDMHLRPESKEDMDKRLSDSREEWLKRCDPATTT